MFYRRSVIFFIIHSFIIYPLLHPTLSRTKHKLNWKRNKLRLVLWKQAQIEVCLPQTIETCLLNVRVVIRVKTTWIIKEKNIFKSIYLYPIFKEKYFQLVKFKFKSFLYELLFNLPLLQYLPDFQGLENRSVLNQQYKSLIYVFPFLVNPIINIFSCYALFLSGIIFTADWNFQSKHAFKCYQG